MSITIQKIVSTSAKKLCANSHELDNSWLEAETLLGYVLNKDRVWIKTHNDHPISKTQTQYFQSLIKRRLKGEPMAYLIGQADFCGQTFLINHHVLIPRIETEEFIYRTRSCVIDYVKKGLKDIVIWDVGTGSGVIAISLANLVPIRANRSIRILASDIDGKVLTVARKNARRLKAKKIKFLKADLLDKKIMSFLRRQESQSTRNPRLRGDDETLIVVANLPYLPLADRKRLSISVTKFEPGRALFTKKNGLFLIHRLMKQLSKFLGIYHLRVPAYRLYVEFDPPQTKKIKSLAQKYFPKTKITVHGDQFKRNRFLEITSPTQQTHDHPS
ncbi:peptide chain release factor N(5)-glutamine methyltransferase [Candidatus Uhrbacteria bacterium]|nr:peptide chain release factor N(5)-glutamine methyltransferase [Candidatus Uhrbacteria bacterium]